MTDLGDLPGGSDYSYANGINAAGQVVGFSDASTGDRAFLWQNGSMTNLGDLPGR
jgi:probable HAF family extracellular repeat protein